MEERRDGRQIEMVMQDGYIDLIQSGVEMALRVGESQDSSLVARRIGQSRRITVASREYLSRRGVPQTPRDLATHDCLLYSRASRRGEWTFQSSDGKTIRQKVQGRYQSDSSEALREAIWAGLGVANVPLWMLKEEAEDPLLQVVLSEFEPPATPIYLLHPASRYLSPRARLFAEYVQKELEHNPWTSCYNGNS